MTEMELKQACAGMSGQQLYSLLSKTEENYNKVYPYCEQYSRIYVDRNEAVKKQDSHRSELKSQLTAFIIFGVLAVFLLILSAGAGILGKLILKFLGIGSLLCAGIVLITRISSKASIEKYGKEIDNLNAQLAEAEKQMNEMKMQYKDDMLIRQWICPDGCVNPKYLRVFVSYFENGRADSLKEAQNLFDEYRHRERMEQMAADQVGAARAAETAAYEALRVANQAASAASSAKTSADWAAFHARNK